MSDTIFRHLGRIKIRGLLNAETGLHIGGSEVGLAIGGTDLTIIRNGLDGRPYVPGSSLKGKMRSMLERIYTPGELRSVGQAKIYKVTSFDQYKKCFISNLFGVTPEDIRKLDGEALPTRLIVRDAMMTEESAAALEKSLYTDMPYTQVKTEVVIDRITSAASPRQVERVPAGTRFHYEIVFNVFLPTDLDWLDRIKEAMDLVEEDYLGGQGSRGYGKVAFETRQVHVASFHPDALDLERDLRVQQWVTTIRKPKEAAA